MQLSAKQRRTPVKPALGIQAFKRTAAEGKRGGILEEMIAQKMKLQVPQEPFNLRVQAVPKLPSKDQVFFKLPLVFLREEPAPVHEAQGDGIRIPSD